MKRQLLFDRELEQSTTEQIKQLNLSMEEELHQQLARQESEGERILERLEQIYEANQYDSCHEPLPGNHKGVTLWEAFSATVDLPQK